nr:putative reverse transcriptase domain-containing protein [Tanacetum cinerariifolium]
MTITRSGMTPEVIEELINQRVAEVLAAYEANHAPGLLVESESQNGDDSDNKNGKGNGDGNGRGDGNENRGSKRNRNPNRNKRCAMHVYRECTYWDFVKYQPLNFKGTQRVVGLTRWFKKIETVFHISNCPERYQVKYATCTMLNNALTWWNSHKRTIRVDAAFVMSWRELMKLMTELVNHDAVIVCDEKIVWIPYGDEVLIVQGDRSGERKKSKLSIISCTKTEKYIKKGCPTFLAEVTKKETEDKSEEYRLEDVPIVRDFLEVFLEYLPGLPLTRQVEFQIDLVPGAAPVARAPYKLAPSELQELSTQLQEL